MCEGVDTYYHNDSVWLIFTDTTEWAIELDKDRTLWYNCRFFEKPFKYVGMNFVDHEEYIIEWVENRIYKCALRIKGEGNGWYEEVGEIIKEAKYNELESYMTAEHIIKGSNE